MVIFLTREKVNSITPRKIKKRAMIGIGADTGATLIVEMMAGAMPKTPNTG